MTEPLPAARRLQKIRLQANQLFVCTARKAAGEDAFGADAAAKEKPPP
jgi:hypothetical protein